MTPREAVGVVLESLHAVTDSYGAPADRANVRKYLAGPVDAEFAIYLYVGRIPLSNFYAHSEQAFDKASLWQEIRDRSGLKRLAQPSPWDVTTVVIDLALWIDANA